MRISEAVDMMDEMVRVKSALMRVDSVLDKAHILLEKLVEMDVPENTKAEIKRVLKLTEGL